jgi:hypothetical protein
MRSPLQANALKRYKRQMIKMMMSEKSQTTIRLNSQLTTHNSQSPQLSSSSPQHSAAERRIWLDIRSKSASPPLYCTVHALSRERENLQATEKYDTYGSTVSTKGKAASHHGAETDNLISLKKSKAAVEINLWTVHLLLPAWCSEGTWMSISIQRKSI